MVRGVGHGTDCGRCHRIVDLLPSDAIECIGACADDVIAVVDLAHCASVRVLLC